MCRDLLKEICMSGNFGGGTAPDNFGDTAPGNQLQTTGGQQQLQTAAASEMFGGMTQAVHNYEGKGIDLWKFTQKVTGGSVKTSDEFPPDGINVAYIYCHKVEMVDPRSGEVTEAFRTVLVDEKGEAYGFVSDGILQAAIGIFKAYNFGQIAPPLKVKLETIKTRSGRKMLTLAPA